jgi:hypothetical protein
LSKPFTGYEIKTAKLNGSIDAKRLQNSAKKGKFDPVFEFSKSGKIWSKSLKFEKNQWIATGRILQLHQIFHHSKNVQEVCETRS